MKMHFKNENDIKSNSHQHPSMTSTTSTTSTSSSTSSTDSGVIIIDNRTTIGKKNNNNNNNDNQKNITNNINYNNNNKNTSQNTDNIKSSNIYRSVENDTTTDKIENTKIKPDTPIWNEKSSNPYNIGNSKCTESNGHDYNNKIANNDDCNIAVKNINIENVINISKSHDSSDASMDSENALKVRSPNKSSNCSPTLSIRSTSISIVSIDGNAIDSSIIDSDSDREADAEGVHTNYVVKKLGQQTTYAAGSPNLPDINKGLTVISQKISPSGGGFRPENLLNGNLNTPIIPTKLSGPLTPTTPQIGSIALTNSTDVTFGDKNFFEGPVTIQQILVDRSDKYKAGKENGHDNPAFTNETGCDTSGTKSNLPPQFNDTPLSFIRRRKTIIITSITIVLAILVGVVILTTQFSKKSNILDDDDEGDITGELQVVGRSDWLARPSKGELDKLNLPVRRVIISHTATDTCMEKAVCINRVRIIQDFHMDSQNWDDIGFNFLIGGDGYVYTGRGWNYVGAHTKGYNFGSIGISFIGTFTTIKPTKRQIHAAKLLIEEGVRFMKIAPDFCIYGARQLGATESPGLSLFNIIKTWPHWSEDIACNGSMG